MVKCNRIQLHQIQQIQVWVSISTDSQSCVMAVVEDWPADIIALPIVLSLPPPPLQMECQGQPQ